MKLLFAFFLLFVVTGSYAQENSFVGKIEYVKEGKLLSGEYVPKKGMEYETFFNSTSYAFFQKSIIDIDAQVNNAMKSMPKEFASDSFEVARQREKLRKQFESQSSSVTNKTVVQFYNHVAQKPRQIDNSSYCVIDSLPKIDWELKADTMTIEGLLCQKARGFFIDKYYTVWFVPAVPFAAGPVNMHGLPGIIVLATSEDEKTRYRMKSLTYPLAKPLIINSCNGEKQISNFDFTLLQGKIRSQRQADIKQNLEDFKNKNDKK
jgi:GLPGLI family protein